MAAFSPVPTSAALTPPRTTLGFNPGAAYLAVSGLPAPSPISPASTESGESERIQRERDGKTGDEGGGMISASPERIFPGSGVRVPGETEGAVPSPIGQAVDAATASSSSPAARTPRSTATRESDETIMPASAYRSPLSSQPSLTRSSALRRASGADATTSSASGSGSGSGPPSSSGSRQRRRPVPLELGPAGRPGTSTSTARSSGGGRSARTAEEEGLMSPSPIGGSSRAFVLGGPDEGEGADGRDLPTPMSFASSGADSDRIISDLHKLDILGQTVRQNLLNRPVTAIERNPLAASAEAGPSRLAGSPEELAVDTGGSSPASMSWSLSASGPDTSGQSSPLSAAGEGARLPPPADHVISAGELLSLLNGRTKESRRLLILDVRPMPAFLVSHLPDSANVVIPSMILRRCKASSGEKWQGGWAALRGFISTEGGRNAWDEAMESGASEVFVVVLGASERKDEAALADTIEMLVRRLAQDSKATESDARDITVKWLAGGWTDGIKPVETFKPLFREGDKSSKARSSSQSRSGAVSSRVPPPIDEGTAVDGIIVATPSSNFAQSPSIFSPTEHDSLGAPPPRKTPVHHPSMPALHLYPNDAKYAPPPLISPGFEASRSAKRHPPRPSPINTTGVGRRKSSTSTGPSLSSVSEPGRPMRPPKLSLNTGAVHPLPLKSASLGAASPWVPIMGNPSPPRKNKGPGLTLTINRSAHDDQVPRSPRKPAHPSIHAACIAQSRMPPSPSSFGGITRRLRQSSTPPGASPATSPSGMTARPDFGQQTSSYFRSPGGSAAYATSPGSANEDDREDPHRDSAPFIVSTVLPQFLYLGPEITTEADVQRLKDLGIKRILNVAAECNDAEDLRIPDRFEKYVQLPLRDIVEETGIAKGVRDACSFLDDARLHSAPTYVHCKAGKSRSVTVVLAYLIHANAWTLKTAYAYVAERRKGISPNIGFVAELMAYEETELGLKASSGVIEHEPSEPQSSLPGSPQGSKGRKVNRYARESLPPAWNSSSLDSGATSNKLTIGMDAHDRSPRPMASAEHTPRPDDSPSRGDPDGSRSNIGQSGTEKEVRRDGQYVHFRRAPVDEHTLQPMRRVSKAGLESLRGMASPQPSPSIATRDVTRTPATERQGWL